MSSKEFHQRLEYRVKEHITIHPSVLYVGTPVALISTLNSDGSTNLSPMSSVWALGDRVVLGMTTSSQGGENLRREGECVINFPSSGQWKQVEKLARATGRSPVPPHKQATGYLFEPDKFAAANLTSSASEKVKPLRVAECPIQFETKLLAKHQPTELSQSRPESFIIFETQVVQVHAHREIVIPGTNHIDTSQWSPLLYVFRHYFGTGRDLGRTFKAEV